MIQYGLISKTDAFILEQTIDSICIGFEDEIIRIAEVGVYSGETGNGLRRYVESKGLQAFLTGIDNGIDKEPIRFHYERIIPGNSAEVYNQLEDNSQHLILIDGNHSYPSVCADYHCYSLKVKRGGYLAFHDIAPQAQGNDYQKIGSEDDKDMYIAVRKALTQIGLFVNTVRPVLGWELVFEHWDENDRCGGVAVFRKLY